MKSTIKRAGGHGQSIFLVFWNLWSVFYLTHKPQFLQSLALNWCTIWNEIALCRGWGKRCPRASQGGRRSEIPLKGVTSLVDDGPFWYITLFITFHGTTKKKLLFMVDDKFVNIKEIRYDQNSWFLLKYCLNISSIFPSFKDVIQIWCLVGLKIFCSHFLILIFS